MIFFLSDSVALRLPKDTAMHFHREETEVRVLVFLKDLQNKVSDISAGSIPFFASGTYCLL